MTTPDDHAPLDERGVEAAAKAIYDNDPVLEDDETHYWPWPESTRQDIYRKAARAAITAYLSSAPPTSSELEGRVGEIRERLKAATPGPWVFATDKGAPEYVQLYSANEEVEEYSADVLSAQDCDVLIGEDDADFIANAPSDIAYLLDQLVLMKTLVDMYGRLYPSMTLEEFDAEFGPAPLPEERREEQE